MGCFLGSKVSVPATCITLSDSAHGCQSSAPISSLPINQWDHIKWNSELAIPLIKSFWAVLLQGAPDPECEPVTPMDGAQLGSWHPFPPRHPLCPPPSYSSSALTIMSQPQWLPVCTQNSPLYLPGTIFSYLYLANSYSSFYPSLNIIFSGKNFTRNPQEKRTISLSLFWEHRVLATGPPGKSLFSHFLPFLHDLLSTCFP